jgi:hypothetical protein
MDVSKQEQPGGQELIQQLISATGLPEELVHQELNEICALAGQNPGELTLDQLREAMLTYLQALQTGELT